jgi:hypothetical protein
MRIGDGLDGFGFEQTLGLELGCELSAMALIGGKVVFGQNDGLAGEAVAKSVERGTGFAPQGDRTRGVGGVLTIDGGPGGAGIGGIGAHGEILSIPFSRREMKNSGGVKSDVVEER